jgi:hypothetical protein
MDMHYHHQGRHPPTVGVAPHTAAGMEYREATEIGVLADPHVPRHHVEAARGGRAATTNTRVPPQGRRVNRRLARPSTQTGRSSSREPPASSTGTPLRHQTTPVKWSTSRQLARLSHINIHPKQVEVSSCPPWPNDYRVTQGWMPADTTNCSASSRDLPGPAAPVNVPKAVAPVTAWPLFAQFSSSSDVRVCDVFVCDVFVEAD